MIVKLLRLFVGEGLIISHENNKLLKYNVWLSHFYLGNDMVNIHRIIILKKL